jgi:hypothetical protein
MPNSLKLLAQRILSAMTLKGTLIPTNSNWITFGPRDVDPGVIHDFHFHFTSPAGYTAVSAELLITCDDVCDISLNGVYISSQTNWQTSNSFCFQVSASNNVLHVRVKNEGIGIPNASAFIATIQINYDDGSFQSFVTDKTWRANDVTYRSDKAGFDDSGWPYANIVGVANAPPW